MYANNAEMMLALRAPSSGWLAVLACVLDEASRDPDFDERQRQIAAQLLCTGGPLPLNVAEAARHRARLFENELATSVAAPYEPEPVAPQRPKLTLVDTCHG
jgi:hypothetical protein